MSLNTAILHEDDEVVIMLRRPEAVVLTSKGIKLAQSTKFIMDPMHDEGMHGDGGSALGRRLLIHQ